MPHDVSLISTIAVGFGLALVLGFAAARLRMPPLVGYLIAGVLIGPGTPGFVADVKLAAQLAEIGVMLLMFGVGLHFSVADLVAVRRIAIPGAIVQIAVAVAMGAGLSIGWGWSLGVCLYGLRCDRASVVCAGYLAVGCCVWVAVMGHPFTKEINTKKIKIMNPFILPKLFFFGK